MSICLVRSLNRLLLYYIFIFFGPLGSLQLQVAFPFRLLLPLATEKNRTGVQGLLLCLCFQNKEKTQNSHSNDDPTVNSIKEYSTISKITLITIIRVPLGKKLEPGQSPSSGLGQKLLFSIWSLLHQKNCGKLAKLEAFFPLQ